MRVFSLHFKWRTSSEVIDRFCFWPCFWAAQSSTDKIIYIFIYVSTHIAITYNCSKLIVIKTDISNKIIFRAKSPTAKKQGKDMLGEKTGIETCNQKTRWKLITFLYRGQKYYYIILLLPSMLSTTQENKYQLVVST